MSAMDILQIETKADEILRRPLLMVCATKKGERRVMTIRECVEAKARYVHVVVDQLDEFLGVTLGGDGEK